nr:hypothetical protein [Tanacetum cinerariifolium]
MSYLLSLKFSNLGRVEVEEDDQERARFRDGKISSRRKKSRGSNIGDSDNTGDKGKTVGGAIGACGGRIGDSLLVALYACMTFIYESSIMPTSTDPFIVPSDSDIEDAFFSTHSPDYISASPDYFPASPENTSPNPSEDLSKYLLASGTLSPMKNLDDAFTFGDQVLNDKSPKDELEKANVETEVESMVTIPIHQASLTVPPLFIPVIDLTPPKPVSPPIQAPTVITATTETTTTTLLLPPQ